jgi:drug/metabolite transporter (DMT)-like permease
MGKIKWIRVLIGGLVAGVVINVLQFAAWALFVRPGLSAALEALGRPLQESAGTNVLWGVWGFVVGILLIWLYAAIRPRYGAGPRTAALAGIAAGLLLGLIPDIAWGSMLRLIPARVWAIDAVDTLVIAVVATLLGAWVYKEQAP